MLKPYTQITPDLGLYTEDRRFHVDFGDGEGGRDIKQDRAMILIAKHRIRLAPRNIPDFDALLMSVGIDSATLPLSAAQAEIDKHTTIVSLD